MYYIICCNSQKQTLLSSYFFSINSRFSSIFTLSITIYWCWHLCHSAFTCCHWYNKCFQRNVFLAFPNRRHTTVPLYDMMLKFYQLMYVAIFPGSEQTNKHWGSKYCCKKSEKRSCALTFKSLAQNVKPRASNLGVFFWCWFEFHIRSSEKKKKKSTFYHPRNIADVQLSLSWADAGGIKLAFITSRLDYRKALFFLVYRRILSVLCCLTRPSDVCWPVKTFCAAKVHSKWKETIIIYVTHCPFWVMLLSL